MAQHYENFEGLATGAASVPSYFIPLGSPGAEIRDETGAENGKALRYEAPGSTDNVALYVDALPATNGDCHVIMRIRYADNPSRFFARPRHFEADDDAATGRSCEFRSNGSAGFDIRERTPGLDVIQEGPDNVVADTTDYFFAEVWYEASTATIRMLAWDGVLGDRPDPGTAGYTVEAVTTLSTSEVAKQSFGGFGTSFAYIDWFGIGTDGDPAPTEAVAPADIALTNAAASEDGETGYAGSVETDTGSGTLYHVVTQSSTAPTGEQVETGEDHTGAAADAADSQSVSSDGTQNVSGSGLSANTEYWIHYYQADGADVSDVVTSPSFTTDAEAPAIGWSTDPAISSVTEDSITVTATPDQEANVFAVALPAGAATPTAQQVADGQDASGQPAEASDQVLATTTEATLVLGTLTAHPSYKVCVVPQVPEA